MTYAPTFGVLFTVLTMLTLVCGTGTQLVDVLFNEAGFTIMHNAIGITTRSIYCGCDC
jgi:hypothetical protein